ncbi:MAG: hypothetical protein Q7J82_07350 [Coriobacteriia bacterium]|nr:hypothetical protein [Coriobacteriia bacterium]
MHQPAPPTDAPKPRRRNVLLALITLTIAILLTACGSQEPLAPAAIDTNTGAPAPSADTPAIDATIGHRMAEKVADFVAGYMLADPDLLASTLSAPNAARVREVAPALEMGGPIGEVSSAEETEDGILLGTIEEDVVTYTYVPFETDDGLTLVVSTWQGTPADRVAEEQTTYTFVLEDGEYRIDRIGDHPASEVLVQ